MSTAAQTKTNILYRVRVTNQDQVQIAFVPLEKFTIGSAPSLPVVLREKSVDKNHLVISCVDGQIWLTDQSMSGTRVNGLIIGTNVPVQYHPGDKIQLGSSEYILQIHIFVQAGEDFMAGNLRAEMVQRAEAEAQRAANRILEMAESQRHVIEANIKTAAIEAAEAKAAEILRGIDSKAIELRKNAEIEAQQLIFTAREEVPKIVAAAGSEALALTKEARDRAELLQNQARHQADSIMDQAKNAAREITAAAEYHAKVISEREAKEQIERLVHAAKIHADQAATAAAERIKNEAHMEAEKILAAARTNDISARAETEKYLSELYDRTFRKSEAMVAAKQREGDQFLIAARTEAIAVRTRAHEEANQLISQARRVMTELQPPQVPAPQTGAEVEIEAEVETATVVEAAAESEPARRSFKGFMGKVLHIHPRTKTGGVAKAAMLALMWLPVVYYYLHL